MCKTFNIVPLLALKCETLSQTFSKQRLKRRCARQVGDRLVARTWRHCDVGPVARGTNPRRMSTSLCLFSEQNLKKDKKTE